MKVFCRSTIFEMSSYCQMTAGQNSIEFVLGSRAQLNLTQMFSFWNSDLISGVHLFVQVSFGPQFAGLVSQGSTKSEVR